jgi:hypothetical protein
VVFERIMAVANELGGAPVTAREPLQLLPAALLLRVHGVIWRSDPVVDKAKALDLSKQKLLAYVVADLVGVPQPHDPETAGQRIDDYLDKPSVKSTYCARLAALEKALRQRETRRKSNVRATPDELAQH